MVKPYIEALDEETFGIDLLYADERFVSSAYLLVDDEPALVETGATPSIPYLVAGVEAAGLTMNDVRHLVVTHIHLDHSGAVGVLMERYPHLRVWVHPRGARHLADPSRLMSSAARVFGDQLEPLFGRVVPAPADRIHPLEDGETVRLGRRTLQAMETPGHASHHHAYWEADRGWVYCGDVAGIHLPGTDHVVPPTPPPDIDVERWKASLQKIRAVNPTRLLYTHFGWTDQAAHWLGEVERHLEERAHWVRDRLAEGVDVESLIAAFHRHFDEPVAARLGADNARRYHLAADAEMNVRGLVRYWQTRSD